MRIVPGEITEFEGQNYNGPGIWAPNFPCHVIFTRPNAEHPHFKNKLEIVILFEAVKVRGDSKNTECQFHHISPSHYELMRQFPEVYSPKAKSA